MTENSVLLCPQGLRPRARAPICPLATPLPPAADTHAWTQAVGTHQHTLQ